MAITVFIAVFFSSVIGAQLFGVSINKLALIPLVIMLFVKNTKGLKFTISKIQCQLLLWQIAGIVSAFAGIIFVTLYSTYATGVIKINIQYIIATIFIWFPLALLLWNSAEKEKNYYMIKEAFVYTARIQAIWALFQFGLYYVVKFDLNRFVFQEMFGGMLGRGSDWTALSNLANSSGGILLRVTGLNRDAAFLGMILIIGFIFECKYVWKYIYMFCMVISFSRGAILTTLVVIIYDLISAKKAHNIKVDFKKLRGFLAVSVGIVCVFVTIYQKNSYVQIQINRLIERFSIIQSGADGTSRHMGYPMAALSLMFERISWISRLFGVGTSCGGVLFTYYAELVPWLGLTGSMLEQSSVWAVESDFANIILGTGIIGFVIYYGFLVSAYMVAGKDTNKRKIILAMAVFGFMYNMASITFVQLLYIAMYATEFKMTTNRSLEEWNENGA